ncbi:MAG: mechanosensitive ion channel [Polyangia bacterium]
MDWSAFLEELRRGLDLELFTAGDEKITVGSVLLLLIVISVTLLLSRLAKRRLGRLLDRSGLEGQTSTSVIPRLAHYAILIGGMVAALQVIGIDLSTLFAAGAVFAVGLGFAMQNIVQNFVSGVILLVERTIKPGDVLEVEGDIVRVVKMRIRATVVRTRNEEELIIPNSTLVQSAVKNFTLTDSRFLLGTVVGVVYGSDMRLVREVLERTAREVPFREAGSEPRVLLHEFGDSSVDWRVLVWVDDPWGSRRLRSELNELIWWALAEAGITIAFPQLDVHFDSPIESSLEKISGG